MIGIARIDINRKDIGIINDSSLDGFPGLSAVGGFVRKIPGACVDDVRSSRIDCERLNVNQIRSILRRQLLPAFARIVRAEMPLNVPAIRVSGSDGDCASEWIASFFSCELSRKLLPPSVDLKNPPGSLCR